MEYWKILEIELLASLTYRKSQILCTQYILIGYLLHVSFIIEEGVATAEIQPHTLRDWFEPLDLIQQELLAFIINKLIISADGGKSGANTDHEVMKLLSV